MKSKRFIITCFSLFLTLSVLAISKDSLHAVTMVSYEQRSTDNEGTLALRNNTGEDIKDVSFRIEYLEMIILLCIGKDESASARYDSPSDLS